MKRLKVMLVDDEVTIIEGFKRLFDWEACGCEVVCEANDGMMAVNQAKIYQPDIIVMDINIPIISGLDAIRVIKQHSLNSAFIVVTGYDEFEYCREALRLQIADYILKPVDFTEFKKVVEDIKLKLIHKTPQIQEEAVQNESYGKLIFRVTSYIQNHLSEDISLQTLSDEFHLNSAYISQMFKNETGVKYHSYLTQIRINKAKSLLTATQNSITEIAAEVGFNDYRTFTKVFKATEGVLPSQYRGQTIHTHKK